ncbi:MAG: hypothetical protein JSR82_21365 [Verrucomicrobia bacterium]|nr:hypothetical protein [Verrucomicrobiota bacterium]
MSVAAADLPGFLQARATEKKLGAGTLRLYERHWSAFCRYCLKHELECDQLDAAQAEAFYRAQTDGRSASHHLGVKAALSFAFRALRAANPFVECSAPSFDPAKVEIAYLDQTALGRLFAALKERRNSYFDRMTWTLACGLFHTACRFNELAQLPTDSLLTDHLGVPTTIRIRIKGGRFRDCSARPELWSRTWPLARGTSRPSRPPASRS